MAKALFTIKLTDDAGDFINDTTNTKQIDVYAHGENTDAHLKLSNHNAAADGDLLYYKNGVWYGNMEMCEYEVYIDGVRQAELGGDDEAGAFHDTPDILTHINNDNIHHTVAEIQTIINNLAAAATTDNLSGTLDTLAGILTSLNTAVGNIPEADDYDQSGAVASINEDITALQSSFSSILSQLELIYNSLSGQDDISVNGVTQIGKNTGTSGEMSLGDSWTAIDGDLLYQNRDDAKVKVAFKATGGANGDEIRVGIDIDGTLHTQKLKSLTSSEATYVAELFLTSSVGIHEYDVDFAVISGGATISKVVVTIE